MNVVPLGADLLCRLLSSVSSLLSANVGAATSVGSYSGLVLSTVSALSSLWSTAWWQHCMSSSSSR